jgi:hypothetical protein
MDETKGHVIVRRLFMRYDANETSVVAATTETEVMFFDS